MIRSKPYLHDPEMINWNQIDTLLLDMDGTLLDLHFDNHYWTKHVPMRFAEAQGLELSAAWDQIFSHMQKIRGTLDFYCIRYWEQHLGLDMLALKHEVAHLIGLRPGAKRFLAAMQQLGKRLILATNAHSDTVTIKLDKTGIGYHFDDIVSSDVLGAAKESEEFWLTLQNSLGFQPSQSLLIDDNAEVLRAAQRSGIKQLLTIQQPDLQQGVQPANEFRALSHFHLITPNPA